ncbi:hypothetical protein [Fundidesulfovibrio putealis]|uniref:hypothetical protein n=1 Tax=Fundidesulfovibrio putealis TaxID=270496 RepID=UPI0003FAD3C9|nr:hypothetical protein [Fundidesulfovibrio putealis]
MPTSQLPRTLVSSTTPMAFALLAVVLLGGCSLGPAKLPATRMDYNLAVQRSANEEMLLNLVRMKYFEQPLFLQVGSIASSFNYNVTGTATGTFPDQRDFLRSIYYNYTPSISATYSDSPTVTYTPYQGQTYAQQFLAEVDFDRFVVLYKSGWDIEYLLRVLVTRLGRLDHSFDPRVGYFDLEAHRRFLELTKIIADMDDRGNLDIVTASPGKDKANVTLMTLRFASEAEAARVAELTGEDLNPKRTPQGHLVAKVRLVPVKERELALEQQDAGGFPTLALGLRNCLRAMDLLSQGIEAPKELVAKKAAFDLREHFSDVMDIRSSRTRPEGSFVAVNHDGWWYSIRREDTRSKEVFQLMLNLFALQSADPPKNTPVLTLPVGGN